MNMNILVTNISDTLKAALDREAAERGLPVTKTIGEILTEALLDETDSITIGFVELINGELGEDYTCPDCSTPVGKRRLFVPVVNVKNPRMAAPVCEFCATTG